MRLYAILCLVSILEPLNYRLRIENYARNVTTNAKKVKFKLFFRNISLIFALFSKSRLRQEFLPAKFVTDKVMNGKLFTSISKVHI